MCEMTDRPDLLTCLLEHLDVRAPGHGQVLLLLKAGMWKERRKKKEKEKGKGWRGGEREKKQMAPRDNVRSIRLANVAVASRFCAARCCARRTRQCAS